MDFTKNEVAGLEVKGFPTLKLFGPGLENGLNFDGDRTLEGMLEFLEKETKLELTSLKTGEL